MSLIALFVLLYVALSAQMPYGGFDALAIWNMRAKFIASGSLRVPSHYFHPDYPPLVGVVIGSLWRAVGTTAQAVPQVVHGVVFAALLWLVRRPLWALAFVGAVGLRFAPWQYADTPLALTFLLAVLAYREGQWGRVGAWLGVGLLIKNEGALMALAFMGAWALHERRVNGRAVAGLAPFMLALVAYKLYVHEPSDLAASGIVGRVTDIDRLREIPPLLWSETWAWGNHALLWLALVLIALGQRVRVSLPLVVVGVVLAGYIGVYVITPHDLTGHITKSWDRLLWQVFPAVMIEIARE